ncbi:UNVERIFIED_ORG: hypothetical protein HNP28_001399 [Comamonas terrigena]
MHEIPSDIANMALEAKALARRNNSRRNLVLLGGIVAGVSVAALWFLYSPLSLPQPKTKFFIGVVLGVFAALFVLFWRQRYYFPNDAKCPACGHSWEIKEGRGVPLSERMEYWDKCPGCGLLMSDELLKLALRSTGPARKAKQSG